MHYISLMYNAPCAERFDILLLQVATPARPWNRLGPLARNTILLLASQMSPTLHSRHPRIKVQIKRHKQTTIDRLRHSHKSRYTLFHPRTNERSNRRTKKKDLLDEVSETEDIITRKKALERGDKLMAAFWDTVAANTVESKSGPSLTATASAVAAVGVMRVGSGGSVAQKWGLASPTSNTVNTGDVGAKAATSTLAARDKTKDEGQQQVPGPGGALSPEAAETCLQLLADARGAYEGQGFALQADGAARLGADTYFLDGTVGKPRVPGFDKIVAFGTESSLIFAENTINPHRYWQPQRALDKLVKTIRLYCCFGDNQQLRST